MKRVLPFVLVLAFGGPAWGQAVDIRGAKQLSDNLSRYVGDKALNEGILKVSVEGAGYKIIFDLQALAAKASKQDLAKFDFPPITLLVKPRGDGSWDVSSDFSTSGSIEISDPNGPTSAQIAIKDARFAGVYDPELAAFTSGVGSHAGITLMSQKPNQVSDLTSGSSSSKLSAIKSANGGVDISLEQMTANFAETVKIGNRAVGGLKTAEIAVDIDAKAIRTKAFLDLLAFAVAHEDEVRLKADQAELKKLLLAALPLWHRLNETYTFKNLTFETYVGNLGATQLRTAFGADGIAPNGKFDYAIKASGLSYPYVIPGWVATLLPTAVDLNFGGSNIDLDSMARKAIETFDLNKNPSLPAGFGDQIKADFMAKTPKFIVDHSVFKNGATEIALEGEMTLPDSKPDANFTVDIAGYDRIVQSLQAAAKSEPEAAQYFPFVLAAQGLAKKLPDGRLEWIINAKPDGSVVVNGAMLKGADPVADDSPGQGNSGDLDDNSEEGMDPNP